MTSDERRDRQRAAERAAARFLGEEESDGTRAGGADEGGRRLFASHLFIDSLLHSWGTDGTGGSSATRERRVARTLDALGEPPRVHVSSRRRALFAVAACLIIGASIAALWFRGSGDAPVDPVRDTIDETLVRISGQLDVVYEGAFSYEFNGRPGDDFLRLVSGPKRHRVDWETMLGEMSFGAVHGRPWFLSPWSGEAIEMTGQRLGKRSGARRRMPGMTQLNWLQDVGGLLRQIRKHYRIDEKPAADGLIRIHATPREVDNTSDEGEQRLRRAIESLDLTIHQKTFRVESIAVAMVRRDDLPMMFPVFVGVRLDFVKSYRAPPELFWPTELGPPPATPAREDDR